MLKKALSNSKRSLPVSVRLSQACTEGQGRSGCPPSRCAITRQIPTPLQLALGEPRITSVRTRCKAFGTERRACFTSEVVLIALYVMIVKKLKVGRMDYRPFDETKVQASAGGFRDRFCILFGQIKSKKQEIFILKNLINKRLRCFKLKSKTKPHRAKREAFPTLLRQKIAAFQHRLTGRIARLLAWPYTRLLRSKRTRKLQRAQRCVSLFVSMRPMRLEKKNPGTCGITVRNVSYSPSHRHIRPG